jgi:hypothetical protein
MNDGVGTLWQWSGGFVRAPLFQSASTGQAYYVRIDEGAGVRELTLPYPGAEPEGTRPKAQAAARPLRLAALSDGTPVSTVEVGFDPERLDGEPAPPMKFQPVGLRLSPPEAGGRQARSAASRRGGNAWLARRVEAVSGKGTSIGVQVKAEGRSSVRIRASGLEALGSRQAALVNPSTGRAHDLHASQAFTVQTPGATTRLRLVVGTGSFVENESEASRPDGLTLRPNRPNPFTDQTTVEYTLPEATAATVSVYDVLGRRVAVLARGRQEAGVHRARWRAGEQASGVYVIRLETPSGTRTRKAVLVR